jgi:hypothetical protein
VLKELGAFDGLGVNQVANREQNVVTPPSGSYGPLNKKIQFSREGQLTLDLTHFFIMTNVRTSNHYDPFGFLESANRAVRLRQHIGRFGYVLSTSHPE